MLGEIPVDLHGYYPADITGYPYATTGSPLSRIIEQAWEMGAKSQLKYRSAPRSTRAAMARAQSTACASRRARPAEPGVMLSMTPPSLAPTRVRPLMTLAGAELDSAALKGSTAEDWRCVWDATFTARG